MHAEYFSGFIFLLTQVCKTIPGTGSKSILGEANGWSGERKEERFSVDRTFIEIAPEHAVAFSGLGGIDAARKPVKKVAVNFHGFTLVLKVLVVNFSLEEIGVVAQDIIGILVQYLLQQGYCLDKFAPLHANIRFEPVHIVKNGPIGKINNIGV